MSANLHVGDFNNNEKILRFIERAGVLYPVHTLGGSGVQVDVDKTAAWVNSAAANTEVNIDIAQPADFFARSHQVQVVNPSAVTALSGTIYNVVTINSVVHYLELATFAIPIGGSKAISVSGMFVGTGGVRIILSNDTVLGASDGFTADLAIREE